MLLSHAANTMTPAYLAILSKGYSVTAEGDYMIAERADARFVAEEPVALLGLIALFEVRGEQWSATDEEIEEFVGRFG